MVLSVSEVTVQFLLVVQQSVKTQNKQQNIMSTYHFIEELPVAEK